jgi:predicted PurR-regulated permease PerM
MDRRARSGIELAGEVLVTFVRYVGGQALIAFVLAIGYGAAFYLLDVPLWFLLAPLCGFFHIIPTIGVILGAAVPLLAAAIAGTSWPQVVGILAVFATANLLETFVLIPLIHGKRLHLHPLAIFLAVLVGGSVFGFLGVLLAVPLLAVAVLLWRRTIGAREQDGGQSGEGE